MPRVALFLLIAPLWAAAPRQQIDEAPGDLRPLLVPAPSELRFVVRRPSIGRRSGTADRDKPDAVTLNSP